MIDDSVVFFLFSAAVGIIGLFSEIPWLKWPGVLLVSTSTINLVLLAHLGV